MYNDLIALIKTCIYDEVRSLYNDNAFVEILEYCVQFFFIHFSLNVSYYSEGCINKKCLGCAPFLQTKSPNIYFILTQLKNAFCYTKLFFLIYLFEINNPYIRSTTRLYAKSGS